MRVTSALWVGAYIRRCQVEGAPAVVVRKGAEEAGAILVIVDRLDGTSDLYGPAAQTAFGESRPSERLFRVMLERARRGILLVDHSKFDQARYEIICALTALDDLVSDHPPPRALAEALARAGVALHLAAQEGSGPVRAGPAGVRRGTDTRPMKP